MRLEPGIDPLRDLPSVPLGLRDALLQLLVDGVELKKENEITVRAQGPERGQVPGLIQEGL